MLDTLPTPADVAAAHPLPATAADDIARHRNTVADVLAGRDPRLLVVVGPCSVHDPLAALEYARLLAAEASRLADDLVVVLRAYLEKPRTVSGWTGLLTDPALEGKGDIATGLQVGRAFLVEAAALGLPLAYEFVDPMLAHHVADTVSWGAVGARTVAAQPHRHLASWLPMPVGLKNCVTGHLGTAIDAIRASRLPHTFPGVGLDGRLTTLRSTGNPDTHLVLRGGREPNYGAAHVSAALDALNAAGLPPRVVVDASHGNSGKDHNRQPGVVEDLAGQIAAGNRRLTGVMIESYLSDGNQKAPRRPDVSLTDACLGWARTTPLLEVLARAVRARTAVPSAATV
ncbi:3-deoxy-7-phosphoheptulonate synthase [Saccharothrix algeriensis]|uniref:Phospho-2-dehydro-3-deoxyheptonate aldolase n=1 Tax=Saccharothrix algeriensis TaxID=173560 RepID=A0A0R5ZN04_9PSEU|nr:3-deoxy-7-phosphoheptulonate synthase [Saccharothrix algeriensis]AJI44169.1 2-keto-3-deoxy-D-arabino-heptulosonate-7 [Saccharothrix algeriensis]MBM7815118.1 3-deoxy-7-phosphoheptulonate synthase [Saccharothrix algeriensis]